MFYAKSTGGFYDTAIHGDAIPADAVEITNEQHAALLSAQSAGKLIQSDDGGNPIAVAPPAPSIETLRARAWESMKAERDRRKAGGVMVGGNWFHSDADSRIQWLGIKDTARDLLADGKTVDEPVTVLGHPLQWKTIAGDFAAVTVRTALDVVTATKELDAVLFTIAEQKRVEMEASADPAAYDVLAGWPSTYSA